MKKFMPDSEVKSVQGIFMTFDGYAFEISIDHKYCSWPQIEQLMKNDGFETIEAMRDFFFPEGCKHDEWSGQIIHWTDLKY